MDDIECVSHRFQLYVVGSSPLSNFAITNIRRICDEHYNNRYVLEVIDVCEHPELAESANILAAPTFIRSMPLPKRRIVGDMTDGNRVIAMLKR